MPPIIPEHLIASYREEAAELIAELEAAFLELERAPADAGLVDRAFRALHTIKGSAAMFGFDALADMAHEVETLFEAIRGGRVHVTPDLIALVLEAKDLLRALLDGTLGPDDAGRSRLRTALRARLPTAAANPAAEPPLPLRNPPTEGRKTYRLRFRPFPDLFGDGTNVLGLLAELRTLGRYQAVARSDALPRLEELSPETCYLGWDLILTTDRGLNAILDAFLFVDGRCELKVEVVDDEGVGAEETEADTRLGRILVDRGEVSPEEVARTLAARQRIGEALAAQGLVSPAAVEAAVVEQKVLREERHRRDGSGRTEAASSIRVAASKLDRLVDLVGELVIAQARLARVAARLEDPELVSVAEDVERLSTELRDGSLEVRMVPIGTTFGRFKRLVHDLAIDLGKEIELVAEGAGTELDKTVIERLGDPLVHLIRNCCDHGIEAPEARRQAGKPARGTIRLSAFQSGPCVVIEIRDDGAGLDPVAIQRKAVERGLIGADARLSDRELFQLVLLPGFSTAQRVSAVSGRGVGMDVVQRAIEGLRGTVDIQSVRGVGTTVRIQLPLTLAIIEGLLVSVGEGSYVFPLSAVEECVELSRQDVERAHGARMASVRGELVPYLRLRELFDVPGQRPDLEQIAIVRHPQGRCGFVVDGVIGQHQTVIKSLGQVYRGVKGLSGATILGDGTVALILDLPALIPSAAVAT